MDYWDRQGTVTTDIHEPMNDQTDVPVRFAFDPYEWNAYPLAAILKAYREAYGLDLPEVSEHLRIRTHYLSMLEDGRYDELPARPYAIGFVRSYAKYLGLPVEEMVERFREEIDDLQVPPHAAEAGHGAKHTARRFKRKPVCLRSFGHCRTAVELDALDRCRQR